MSSSVGAFPTTIYLYCLNGPTLQLGIHPLPGTVLASSMCPLNLTGSMKLLSYKALKYKKSQYASKITLSSEPDKSLAS